MLGREVANAFLVSVLAEIKTHLARRPVEDEALDGFGFVRRGTALGCERQPGKKAGNQSIRCQESLPSHPVCGAGMF